MRDNNLKEYSLSIRVATFVRVRGEKMFTQFKDCIYVIKPAFELSFAFARLFQLKLKASRLSDSTFRYEEIAEKVWN